MTKNFKFAFLLATAAIIACNDDDSDASSTTNTVELTNEIAKEIYTGGELGTTFVVGGSAYEQPAPATENQGFEQAFKFGEYFFEHDFTEDTTGAFPGLGPLMVRRGCLYCHPNYGHGKRQNEYRANTEGNGYLLVLYDLADNSYLTSVTGMPQTLAVDPFKAPIDEEKISIEWKTYTDEWGNAFADGETYNLTYPEVTIPADAYYVPIQSKNGTLTVDQVGVRLESTIGVIGVGLIDAIPEDSLKAQYAKYQAAGVPLNPSIWNGSDFVKYKGLTGVEYNRRWTYALSRGPLLDGPGANAIWNITNVTRSDRRYHYMTTAYATTASQDPDVQAAFYNYFPNEKKYGSVEKDIYHYLMGTDTAGNRVAKAEMTDEDYKNLMIWHRGLAIPAARDFDREDVQRGRTIFREIGCATCHRPSWTTGDDHIQDPNGMFDDSDMPRFPNQVIWPYSDLVQHRLYMENDIRTGWCRTTPLWGRGLSKLATGAEERLHDCRAQTVIEAIMWHGNPQSDARASIEKFRELSKADRDAVVAFINAI